MGGGIGIVGTGISGLHLALYLQQRAIPTTLYSAEPPEQIAAGPLANTVTRWGPTLEREARLGVDDGTRTVADIRFVVAGDPPLRIRGRLDMPADSTDFRVYLPRLIGIYRRRGGRLVVGPCGADQAPQLAAAHELLVVAAGGGGYKDLFPRHPGRSVHYVPPRRWTVSFCQGLRAADDAGVEITVVPGVGEMFCILFRSFDGPAVALGFAALPGGPLDHLPDMTYTTKPRALERAMLDALRSYAPWVHDRLEPARFGVRRPLDILQGAFVPVVRQAWSQLDGGRCVMAVGDAWVLNDPILAQGANLGSRSAFALGDAIAAGGPYDEAFCAGAEEAMWAGAEAPCALTNAFLAPPDPAVVDLLARATRDQLLADRLANMMSDPEAALALLGSSTAAAV